MLVVGPNGAGKTNLLESLHVGTQGFSPRTRADAQLVRFGERAGRIALQGRRGDNALQLEVTLEVGEGKRAKVNGAALRAAEQLRSEVATLVFTPDRLAVVKGGPAVRRAYFDRVLGRLAPARASLAVEYAAAVAQRNAALRRAAGGYSSRDAGEPPTVETLEARLDRDLERGTTGLGPHLDDIVLTSGPRDLRSFGSQGEQRLTVLALLLAEASLIAERRGFAPLLLLDDVLSELDPGRRRVLAERVLGSGQTLITATEASALPVDPAQLLEVASGEVRAA